jgi:hypothetical protein
MGLASFCGEYFDSKRQVIDGLFLILSATARRRQTKSAWQKEHYFFALQQIPIMSG